ncbi:unnamed protein product [Closterium sp. Yama58-4]|nr:unnamed protein product [Closterium sp. Yama58-4]
MHIRSIISIFYGENFTDQYYDAAEAREPVVEEANATAEDEGGREPVTVQRDGGEEGGPEAGADEADDEETESEYGDPILNVGERLADEGDGEEEEAEFMDASEGDDDDASSDDEEDEETETDFSDAKLPGVWVLSIQTPLDRHNANDLQGTSSPLKANDLQRTSSPLKANDLQGTSSPLKANDLQGTSSPLKANDLQGTSSPLKANGRRDVDDAGGADDLRTAYTTRIQATLVVPCLWKTPASMGAIHRRATPRELTGMLAAVHVDGLSAHTRLQYACNWHHYKRWVLLMMMTLLADVIPESEKIDPDYPDEVGRYMGDDARLSWESVDDSVQHLHGPRVTGRRIMRYLEYLFNETPEQARTLKGDAPVVAGREPKPSTPKMIKAKMNAIGCLGRCESALYDYPLTKMQDKVAEGRAFMRVKLVNLNEEQIRTGADQHRGSLDDCYNADQYRELHHNTLPEETFKIYARSKDFPSQALWRVLAVKVMIQLAHQVLGRGVSIRKIRFANMFIRMCRSSTRVNGKMDLPVLVIASRKTKTNLSNNLTHQYLARHLDWQLRGVGGVFLWIHWLYDLVPIRYGNKVLPRLNFRKPRRWSKKHLFFGIRKPNDPPPQRQDEMKYETHNNWIRWVMKQAKWMFSKVTHIF